MPTVVVGGNARHVGKTSLICGLIAAFPECPWTAIKITSHDHGKPVPVWEETDPGQGTDTARYLAAGAGRALLATASDGKIPAARLRAAIAEDRWLIFETNQIQLVDEPSLVLAVVGAEKAESKPSFAAVLRRADAIIHTGSGPTAQGGTQPIFVLQDLQHPTPDLMAWMRTRLGLSAPVR